MRQRQLFLLRLLTCLRSSAAFFSALFVSIYWGTKDLNVVSCYKRLTGSMFYWSALVSCMSEMNSDVLTVSEW